MLDLNTITEKLLKVGMKAILEEAKNEVKTSKNREPQIPTNINPPTNKVINKNVGDTTLTISPTMSLPSFVFRGSIPIHNNNHKEDIIENDEDYDEDYCDEDYDNNDEYDEDDMYYPANIIQPVNVQIVNVYVDNSTTVVM